MLQLDKNGAHCKRVFTATASGKSNDDADEVCWKKIRQAAIKYGAKEFTVRGFYMETL